MSCIQRDCSSVLCEDGWVTCIEVTAGSCSFRKFMRFFWSFLTRYPRQRACSLAIKLSLASHSCSRLYALVTPDTTDWKEREWEEEERTMKGMSYEEQEGDVCYCDIRLSHQQSKFNDGEKTKLIEFSQKSKVSSFGPQPHIPH